MGVRRDFLNQALLDQRCSIYRVRFSRDVNKNGGYCVNRGFNLLSNQNHKTVLKFIFLKICRENFFLKFSGTAIIYA